MFQFTVGSDHTISLPVALAILNALKANPLIASEELVLRWVFMVLTASGFSQTPRSFVKKRRVVLPEDMDEDESECVRRVEQCVSEFNVTP